MKVYTVNLRNSYKRAKTIIKLLAIILVLISVVKISVNLFMRSRLYAEALNEITEKTMVIIDAGHGGEDCGAIGVSGVYEKDLNLSIALELGRILSENGITVVYTRTNDALLYTEEENIHGIRKISDLKNRCKIAAEYPKSIFVSIHMNSYKSAGCKGLQVYYSEKNKDSYALASAVQLNVKNRLQNENKRQIKAGKSMYLLENIDNPAILIECGFLTNFEECENLSEKEYQKELSFSIFCGIIEYIRNRA